MFRLIFIGICAVFLVFKTQILLGSGFDPVFFNGFVFGSCVFAYYFTHPDRLLKYTGWGFGAMGMCCLVIMGTWPPFFELLIVLPFLVWLGYYGFTHPGNRGLRAISWAKPTVVAMVWSWVTVVLPLPQAPWEWTFLLWAETTAFIFALALAYDVGDIPYDQARNLPTLARTLQADGIFKLSVLSLGVSGFFVITSIQHGIYDLITGLSQLMLHFFSIFWLYYMMRFCQHHAWYKVLIDTLIPLQCSLVLLLR